MIIVALVGEIKFGFTASTQKIQAHNNNKRQTHTSRTCSKQALPHNNSDNNQDRISTMAQNPQLDTIPQQPQDQLIKKGAAAISQHGNNGTSFTNASSSIRVVGSKNHKATNFDSHPAVIRPFVLRITVDRELDLEQGETTIRVIPAAPKNAAHPNTYRGNNAPTAIAVPMGVQHYDNDERSHARIKPSATTPPGNRSTPKPQPTLGSPKWSLEESTPEFRRDLAVMCGLTILLGLGVIGTLVAKVLRHRYLEDENS
jgi:hypothetical protein